MSATLIIKKICLSVSFCALILLIFLFCPEQPCSKETMQQHFTIGISSRLLPNLDLRDAHAAMDVWFNEIAQRVGVTGSVKVIIFNDLPSVVTAIQAGKVDIIALHSLDYLRIKDRTQLEAVMLSINDSDILLVHKDQGITSLDHLRNKKLLIQAGVMGEVSLMWLDINLRKKKLPETNRFFQNIKEVAKASNAVLQVFFKQSDACIVNRRTFETMVEQNPQLGESLLVIFSTKEFPKGIFSITKSMDAILINKIVETALGLQEHSSGRQILMLFHVYGIKTFSHSYLSNLTLLMQEHNSLSHISPRRR